MATVLQLPSPQIAWGIVLEIAWAVKANQCWLEEPWTLLDLVDGLRCDEIVRAFWILWEVEEGEVLHWL